MGNRANYPVEAPDIQRQFPASLLMSGTRDLGLSRTVFAHSLLVDLGVEAKLHVWEGAAHCAFAQPFVDPGVPERSEEHTSELQSLMPISYAVFCLKKKKTK